MESAISKVRNRNYHAVELNVVETQKAAINLYKSLGFMVIGSERVLLGGERYTEFKMNLDLNAAS